MSDFFRKFAPVFICGMIGIILAFILYLLHINGIVVDEYVTESATITIENVMTITIIVWAMIGVVISAFD